MIILTAVVWFDVGLSVIHKIHKVQRKDCQEVAKICQGVPTAKEEALLNKVGLD